MSTCCNGSTTTIGSAITAASCPLYRAIPGGPVGACFLVNLNDKSSPAQNRRRSCWTTKTSVQALQWPHALQDPMLSLPLTVNRTAELRYAHVERPPAYRRSRLPARGLHGARTHRGMPHLAAGRPGIWCVTASSSTVDCALMSTPPRDHCSSGICKSGDVCCICCYASTVRCRSIHTMLTIHSCYSKSAFGPS